MFGFLFTGRNKPTTPATPARPVETVTAPASATPLRLWPRDQFCHGYITDTTRQKIVAVMPPMSSMDVIGVITIAAHQDRGGNRGIYSVIADDSAVASPAQSGSLILDVVRANPQASVIVPASDRGDRLRNVAHDAATAAGLSLNITPVEFAGGSDVTVAATLYSVSRVVHYKRFKALERQLSELTDRVTLPPRAGAVIMGLTHLERTRPTPRAIAETF